MRFARLNSKIFWSKQVWILEKIFTRFTSKLESSQSSIWLMTKFDEFSMTSVKSGLMIEGLNHTITIPKGSHFQSTGLLLYTTRCHWWIVRFIISSWWWWPSKSRLNIIPIHWKKFRWYCNEDYSISHYEIE